MNYLFTVFHFSNSTATVVTRKSCIFTQNDAHMCRVQNCNVDLEFCCFIVNFFRRAITCLFWWCDWSCSAKGWFSGLPLMIPRMTWAFRSSFKAGSRVTWTVLSWWKCLAKKYVVHKGVSKILPLGKGRRKCEMSALSLTHFTVYITWLIYELMWCRPIRLYTWYILCLRSYMCDTTCMRIVYDHKNLMISSRFL